jgi:uncharacterized repeat protein (TIGR03803 family)
LHADHPGNGVKIPCRNTIKTEDGYANAPTTLVNFNGGDGEGPTGSLISDAAGDLLGLTYQGGTSGDGTVFEIAKTEGGYAAAPTTLVNFNGSDGEHPICGGLITDSAGDLFGTTNIGGSAGAGTVFEITKTEDGYAGTPVTLVSFDRTDGAFPQGGLVADAAGNLFGTTAQGGTDNDGTVFEIAKTQHGYASAPTILVSFTGSDGEAPQGTLIADAAGDLFGTTDGGGADNDGTVFEIARTKHGYASGPTTLVSFTGADGQGPLGGLIADALGNLFGTTIYGGTYGEGTVFEIAKTQAGYAAAPTILVNFKGSNGEFPESTLIADAAGNLFGTTYKGGTVRGKRNQLGTVFEITNSGFVPPGAPAESDAVTIHSTPLIAAFVQAMAATPGDRGTAGLFNASRSENNHQLTLSAPRLAIA